nr:MAG TPA: hypothetical protein [Caudoviricetes sp.]
MVVRCILLMPTRWFLHHFREVTKMVCPEIIICVKPRS